MSKDPFHPIDSSILSNYTELTEIGVDIADEIKKGYLGTSSYFTSTFRYLFESETGQLPKSKSKIFFTPGCATTQSRLKEITKQVGHTMTSDYTEADVIIVGTNALQTNNYDNLKSYHIGGGGITELAIGNVTRVEEYLKDNPNSVGVYYCSGYGWSTETIAKYGTVVSPMLIGIDDRIRNQDIPFMSESTFISISNSAVRQALTEETMESILQLIQTYDDDNRKLAAQLLINIDPKKNRHLLWQLFDHSSISYLDNRNKDYQAWLKESNYYQIHDLNAEDMLRLLKKADDLTSEAFLYLEPKARKEIRITNRSMYKVTFTLKEEWLPYLKTKEDGN